MSAVQIRHATRADLDHLAAIEAAADRLYIERFGATDCEQPRSGHERAQAPGFLLVVGVPPYGFAHVLEVEGQAHLEQLAVAPGHQRRGIGRALVDAAKAEAATRGYAELSLMTYADVPWNAPFYATCGFIETEPTTAFHRRLLRVEQELGLERDGRRVLMVARLESDEVTGR